MEDGEMGHKITQDSTSSTHDYLIRKRNIKTLIWQRVMIIVFAIAALLIILANPLSSTVISSPPPLQPHRLPPTLAQWEDKTNSGDYFPQIMQTEVGYLVWSQFPVRVYVESPTTISNEQAEAWVNAILQAVQEWNIYLPLTVVKKSEDADITILRKAPPLQFSRDVKIPRARSAQTTYNLYTSTNHLLSHRFTILLSPSQTGQYLLAAARHELGHALGIWGHSPLQSDALYFSQVRNPPVISPRDVNTLKRVYQQPTRLGWRT
jgi:predicted Zn-dependent protease